MKRIIAILVLFCWVSDLRSQEILIPYRKGKLWGLADTLGTIKVTPAYDTVYKARWVHYGDTFVHTAITKRNDSYGVLVNGREVLRPEHGKLSTWKGFVNEVIYNSSAEYDYSTSAYTLSGELIQKNTGRIKVLTHSMPYILGRQWSKTFYETTSHSGKESICVVDVKTQTVDQWLVKDCEAYWFHERNNGYYLYVVDSTNKEHLYELNYKSNTSKIQSKKVDLAPFHKMLEKDAEYELDETEEDISPYAVDRDEDYGIPRWKPAEVQRFSIQKKGLHLEELMGRYDKKYNLITLKSISERPIENVKGKQYTLRKFANWETDEYPNYKNKLNKDLVFVLNYATAKTEQGSFIFTDQGRIAVDFDSILGFSAKGNDVFKHHFLIGKRTSGGNMKYGVISSAGKWAILPVHDSIDFNLNSQINWVIASKEGKQFLFRKSNYAPMLEKQGYDKITKIGKWGEFGLYNKGAYGYFYRITLFEPQFKYPVRGIHFVCRTKLAKLYDDKDQFLGYADSKGVYYFED